MLATLVNTVVRTSSRPVCNLCSSCMRRDPENRRAHSNDIAASQSYSCAVGDAGHGIVFRLTRRLSLAPSPMYPHSPFTFNRNGPLLLHIWSSSWASRSTPFGCQGKTSLPIHRRRHATRPPRLGSTLGLLCVFWYTAGKVRGRCLIRRISPQAINRRRSCSAWMLAVRLRAILCHIPVRLFPMRARAWTALGCLESAIPVASFHGMLSFLCFATLPPSAHRCSTLSA